MKLTDVINVWECLHIKDTGELGFYDLQSAIAHVIGIENDIPKTQPIDPATPAVPKFLEVNALIIATR